MLTVGPPRSPSWRPEPWLSGLRASNSESTGQRRTTVLPTVNWIAKYPRKDTPSSNIPSCPGDTVLVSIVPISLARRALARRVRAERGTVDVWVAAGGGRTPWWERRGAAARALRRARRMVSAGLLRGVPVHERADRGPRHEEPDRCSECPVSREQ